jgi:Tfp pilus assembly major pilin PilA
MMRFVPIAVTRLAGKAVLQSKKNSPHIFFGAGVAGACVSTFLACRATLKLEPVLDEIKSDIDQVNRRPSVADNNGISYTDQEHRRDLAYAYLRGGRDLGKLYGPAFVVGAASIAALTGSHVQLSRRNAALTAAYAGIAQALEEYRARVRAEVGDEKESDIWLGIEEQTVTDEDGKKQKVKVAANPERHSRFFDQKCGNWKPDPDYNRFFLQSQQNFWNQRLNAYGYVFLNDVYESLGYERTSDGQLLGWTLDSGDGYISFGLDDHLNVKNRDVLGWSQLLTFNIDTTVMYHKI